MRLRIGLLAVLAVLLSGTALGQAVVNGAVTFGNSSKPARNYDVHLVKKPNVDLVVKTGDDGSYQFVDVAWGSGYAVAVYDQTGKLVGTDTLFSVSESNPIHVTVPDIDISHGGVTETRANQSGGFIQNDLTISPGTNITNEQIRVLPLYNRNFLNLGLIQPGVHDVEQGSPLQGAAFSIAGSRSTATYFLLDGVDNVASSTNQAIPFQVNEAVREFRVIYANPDLRYGQGSGGIVDVISSSGIFGDKTATTSPIHGSVFGYFNNDALNSSTPLSVYSNSGFAKAAAYSTILNPSFTVVALSPSQQPAAPITNCSSPPLPSYVVFCGYAPQSYNELFNLLSPGSPIGITSCNTALCSAGAFNSSGVLSSQDSHTQPITSKQFGGSIGGAVTKHAFLFGSYEGTLIDNPNPIFERVPTYFDRQRFASASVADQNIAQGLLALYPAPNVGQTGSSLIANSGTGVLGFYRGTAPNYTHVHTVQVRPDISLGSLGSLSLRYTGQLLDQLHDDTLPASGSYPGNGADRRAQNQSAAISYNSQFGQNRNILNIAFTQYRVDEVAQDRNFNVSSTGLNYASMPTFAISGLDDQTTASTVGGLGYVGGWYDSFWQTNCPAGSGISACENNSGGQSSPSPITPSLDGDFPLARLGPPLSAPSKHRDTEAFLSDALQLHISNRSILTVGGDYRYQQNFSDNGGQTRGLIVSNNLGEFTHDSETCISCTPRSAFSHPSFDYELRQPADYVGDLRSSSFGVFAQDSFKITKNMTLQAGVRYEYFGQPLDTQNRLWNYSFVDGGLNRQGATGTFDAFDYQCTGTSYGTTFFDSLYGLLRSQAVIPAGSSNCASGTFKLPQINNDVTGLIGTAYSWGKDARNVVRGAIGGYFDHAPSSYNEKLLQNRPSPYNVTNPSSVYGQNFASTYASPTCQQGTQCAFGLSTLNLVGAPVPSPITSQTATFQNYQAASSGEVMYARNSDALKTPYLLQFSASYQYRFSGSWNGEIGYVGSHGTQLPLVYDGNFSNEFYCDTSKQCTNNTYFPVFTQSNIGSSNYNSLVARVEGRLYKGLSMHASYTYAKSLDNIASSDFPNATDALFTQLFGHQLYGIGNPAAFALQSSSAGYGSNGGVRGAELSQGEDPSRPVMPGTCTTPTPTCNPNISAGQLLKAVNVPTFAAIQAALTTTGNRVVNVSHYNLPQNPLAFSSQGVSGNEDYGRSDDDVRHRIVADFVYRPTFTWRWSRHVAISGITTIQTGQPFTIFSGPAYNQITQRISLPSAGAIKTSVNPAGYFSGVSASNFSAFLPSLNSTSCPSLYATPTLYQYGSNEGACLGNSGRNIYTGPTYFSQDLAVQKGFVMHENHVTHEDQLLNFRAEFYNLTNRSNYYNPISEISPDGVHLNPEFGLIRSAHDPREIQFAVRYDF